MATIAVFGWGQSNERGHPHSVGGDTSIPQGAGVFNNTETGFGTAYWAMAWGRYPTDQGQSLPLAFCRRVVNVGGDRTRLFNVAKGGHPIECFLRQATLEANGWSVPAGKTAMGPLIYTATKGAKFALGQLGKTNFDVVMDMQGEANGADSVEVYRDKRLAMIQDMLGADLITAETPLIVGGLYEGGPFYQKHKDAIAQVAAVHPNVIYVDSAGLAAADGIHLTGSAVVTLGQRMANAYLAARGA